MRTGCTTIRSRTPCDRPGIRATARPTTSATSAFVRSNPSSSRKRRSNTARHRSATHGVWMPPTLWPPSTPFTFSVAWRAPSGTTGTAVVRDASAGCSSSRNARSTRPIPSMAFTPRNGMLPWPIRPRVSTSNQYTPRWPTQMRSTPSGSGMMTASVRSAAIRPCSASQATPAKPPLSSSTVPLTSTVPASATPARRIASTAKTAAARPAFMSHAPRP